jgi:hypothetical protein
LKSPLDFRANYGTQFQMSWIGSWNSLFQKKNWNSFECRIPMCVYKFCHDLEAKQEGRTVEGPQGFLIRCFLPRVPLLPPPPFASHRRRSHRRRRSREARSPLHALVSSPLEAPPAFFVYPALHLHWTGSKWISTLPHVRTWIDLLFFLFLW